MYGRKGLKNLEAASGIILISKKLYLWQRHLAAIRTAAERRRDQLRRHRV